MRGEFYTLSQIYPHWTWNSKLNTKLSLEFQFEYGFKVEFQVELLIIRESVDPTKFQNPPSDLLATIKLFTGNVVISLKLSGYHSLKIGVKATKVGWIS